MQKQRFILALFAMLLWLAGAQQVKAEDNQPRFMIPTMDFACDGKAMSAIIESNPYFTIYLWVQNTEHLTNHSYWYNAPQLTVDGYSMTLDGLVKEMDLEELGKLLGKTLVCHDNDSVYYYVRYGNAFKAEDNNSFITMYSDLKNKSAWEDDWYIPIDIYIRENHSSSGQGEYHTIKVAGNAVLDNVKGHTWVEAQDLNNNKELHSGRTTAPFDYTLGDGKVKWSAPKEQTYTSGYLYKKNWGQYSVVFDNGEESDKTIGDGRIDAKRTYDNPNYQNKESLTAEYRYTGVFDVNNSQKRYTGTGTASLSFASSGALSSPCFFDNDNANVLFTFDNPSILQRSYAGAYFQEGMSLTFKALDKKICKVELRNYDNTYQEYNIEDHPQKECSFKVDYSMQVNEIRITFDQSTAGFPLIFKDTYKEAPSPLSYPINLTSSGDAWGKMITLKWNGYNDKDTSAGGVYIVFRDGEPIDTLSRSLDDKYSTEDKVAYGSYNYKVTFVPGDWTELPNPFEDGLSASITASLDRTVRLENLTVTTKEDGFQLNWEVPTGFDKDNTYKFYVYRLTAKKGAMPPLADEFTDTPIDSVIVAKQTDTKFTYLDKAISSTDSYYYLVKMFNIQDGTLTSEPVGTQGHPDASHVHGMTASQGTDDKAVHLSWSSSLLGEDQLTGYIYRHRIAENDNMAHTVDEAIALGWEQLYTFVSSSKAPVESYDDTTAESGYYYQYAVVAWLNDTDSMSVVTADGFLRSAGEVSGLVTYENGKYGVEGVKIELQGDDSAIDASPTYAIGFSGQKGGAHWKVTNEKMKNYFSGPFSVQMYVRPDANITDNRCLLDMGGALRLHLLPNDGGSSYAIAVNAQDSVDTQLTIPSDFYTHLTFAYNGNDSATIHLVYHDQLDSIATQSINTKINIANASGHISVGANVDSLNVVNGYIDEVRFFSRQLTQADVKQNFGHYLGGKEKGLVAYWPFDEGVKTMRQAYDCSMTGNSYNENHATIYAGLRSSTCIPTNNQLARYAVTDTTGAYFIRSIPFKGDGTQYVLIPSKGTHQFSPTAKTLSFSQGQSSLTQNFVDESSFNVKGVVYYENTTYPVAGCSFKVDDVQVKDKNDNPILSDGNGKFTIPVSIGHHVITIEKEGHTFLNDGHYPATGEHNFNDSISHLTFTDQTKAIVVGRVVGGDREKLKPLGIGNSKANIGAATLTLLTSSSVENSCRMNVHMDPNTGDFVSNDEPLYYEQANPGLVNSTAWAGGNSEGPDQVRYITIKTDPNTGEFAVKLPPVPYYIATKVDNNTLATTALGGQVLLDCSNVLDTTTDTDGMLSMTYNTAFVHAYTSAPVISVEQKDNSVGAFGDAKLPAGELDASTDVYTAENGVLTYNYGNPIFTSCQTYKFGIKAYEQYFNYDLDPEEPLEDRVPTTEGYLHISNPMALAADTVAHARLDSTGYCGYQFQAIEPNVVAPYTQPLEITLIDGESSYPWRYDHGDENGIMQCVVFGTKLTGNTSVTAAPDQLLNILRDPFGSNSNVVWETGSTHAGGFDVKLGGALKTGSTMEGGQNAGLQLAEGAPGLYMYSETSLGIGETGGLDWKVALNANGGVTWNVTNTESFQTSSQPYYDGPNGDVFIGTSSSVVYGDGQKVTFIDNQDGTYHIGTQEVVAMGQKLETRFAYTQDYIINHLIPQFKNLRQARLLEVSEADLAKNRADFTNDTDSIIYMTSLTPDDPRFGTNNDDAVWGDQAVDTWHLEWRSDRLCYSGPSYTAFLPASGNYKDEEEMWDAIVTINSNIKLWEDYLRLNEEQKVRAIQKDDPELTLSFDSGNSYHRSHDKSHTGSGGGSFEGTLNSYQKMKVAFNVSAPGEGTVESGEFELNLELNAGVSVDVSGTTTDNYTVNLDDGVNDNSHSIKMYDGDDYGYIFYQYAGQTSRNYEGEKRTAYFEPGAHVLSKSTEQIEVPHIDCDQRVITGVPEGQAAVFNLRLSNATAATLRDGNLIDYDLWVDIDKYSNVVSVTPGVGEFNGYSYKVELYPGDVAEMALLVKPIDNSVTQVDSLHVYFSSHGQASIYDDIYLTAHFLPTPDDVALKASTELVNTKTDSTLTLTISDYNRNSKVLKAICLQQKRAEQSDQAWTTLHSWVTGTPAGDTESKLYTDEIDTLVDMRSSIAFPDATYQYRAITDCTIGEEQVFGQSDIVTVVKDVTLPKPLYLPEPADGVLSAGDNIFVQLNEDIHSQSLTDVDNFLIQSVLNTDSVAHDVALQLDGSTTPAATSQSQLVLGGTSFTLCSWVKTSGTDGTLFRHGEGRNAFCVNINADGYLSANIKDENGVAQTYTATQPIPKDIWNYVGVVYDQSAGTLSAYSAYDDQELNLMTDVGVGKSANSEGYIYLGEGMTGAMHELSLFSAPLTWTAIKAQMYLGKSHTTPALIGYWRLDEGHGTTSEDRARNRHMLLPTANHWYLENENISLGLDGTHYAGIPMGMLSTTAGVSYLVEMWERADEGQQANAQLLSLDNGQKLDLNIVDGMLQLVADSTAHTTAVTLADNQWHHVAINVLKGTGGQANLLVDGVNVLSVPADEVPALAGSHLWLGRNMKGMVDEVRLWHGTNTQEAINERMYYRLDGSQEKGLAGYWPMEETKYDEYDQRVFNFSLNNKGYNSAEGDGMALVADAEGVTLAAGSEAPGLKMAPNKTNLDFDFSASENVVSIFLDHSPKSLEGCTVSVTLRDYYDMHSNVGNPITWSFQVKQNPLTWNTTEIDKSVLAGMSDTFTATLSNNSAGDQSWSLDELPSWLEANLSSGTIPPYGSQDVTFTVKPGIAIGKHIATVSANAVVNYKGGKVDLDTPLDICITVEGKKPDWVVDYSKYDRSMTVTAQIMFNGIASDDPNDIIGAFTDANGESLGDCIGLGQPTYIAAKDAYLVSMMVYANSTIDNDSIRFRLYDASTGLTYPLTSVKTSADAAPQQGLLFTKNATVGNFDTPVVIENLDKLLQTMYLKAGNNWTSLYLDPVRKELTNLFGIVSEHIASVALSDDEEITYNGETWSDTSKTLYPGQMMVVNMNDDAILPVVGDAVDPADYPITIKPGNNWIGIPVSGGMSLVDAFAGLAPANGDQIKSQTAFSTYYNGSWTGTLEGVEPGQGYIYSSVAENEKQFTFPVVQPKTGIQQWNSVRGIEANYKYPHNMTVVCTVHNEYGQNVLPQSIEAYSASGELRGRATSLFRDNLLLLVISGKTDGEPLVLRANVRGYDDGRYTSALSFKKNHILGALHRPHVIGSAATDISSLLFAADSRLAVYSLTGLVVYQGKGAQFDKSRLTTGGIYIIQETTADGQILFRKVRVE